ncbi:MAG: glycosyltransferase [Patescibacteria group bacterium]
MTDIYIPILRTNRIDEIKKNISQTTYSPYKVYFIVEKPDFERLKGSTRDEILLNTSSMSYPGAINSAFNQTNGDYFFCGADDLKFYPNWLEIALKYINDYGVVGTNDKLNIHVKAQKHATHCLVNRNYINKYRGTIDGSYPVLFEYKHNYCDTEFIQTAIKRNEFKPCLESVVRHEHWSKGRNMKDEIYEKSEKTKHIDQQTFNSRSYLWQ